MKKNIIITIVAVVAAVAGLAFLISMSSPERVDYIMEPSEKSGNIPEKVIGDPNTAKVVVYEYADYGCSHCATWNSKMGELLDKYSGKLALVFRGFDLGFQNGHQAAAAATAAQLQGFWKGYKDLLFANQAEWANATTDELEGIFSEYFQQVSGENGNIEQFLSDMASENVNKRISYEHSLGVKAGVNGTPTFHINGKQVNLANLEQKIEEKCKD